MHTIQCILHSARCMLHTTECTLYSSHYRVHTKEWTLHGSQSHYTVHTTQGTLHSSHYKVHTTECTLHKSHYRVHCTHDRAAMAVVITGLIPAITAPAAPFPQPVLLSWRRGGVEKLLGDDISTVGPMQCGHSTNVSSGTLKCGEPRHIGKYLVSRHLVTTVFLVNKGREVYPIVAREKVPLLI